MLQFPKYSLWWCIIFFQIQLSGQVLTPDSANRYEIYDYNVKQFDDFADRFNFKTDYRGKTIIPVAYAGPSRQTIIASLFNHDDPRMIKSSEFYSPEYEVLIREFIYVVCRDSLSIDKNSENLFASAETRGRFRDRIVNFNIILNQERVGKDMIKWVIRDIEADFLYFLLEDTTILRFLPPSSGELDFKELKRALKDLDYLQYYAHKNYSFEPTSVFFYLQNKGEMEIESIQEVKYRVLDIPGWCMILKDFNRLSKNSGWLIEDIYKTKTE
jgi:hypothetical protein